MNGRREILGFLTDDLLAWWLSGTHDEAMKEWWATSDAVDTATETIHCMIQSLEDHGWQIVRRPSVDEEEK